MSYGYMQSHINVNIKGGIKRIHKLLLCCSFHTKASFLGFNKNIL